MRTIITLMALLMSTAMHAQEAPVKVPEAAAKVISSSYPTASELKWSEKKGRFPSKIRTVVFHHAFQDT